MNVSSCKFSFRPDIGARARQACGLALLLCGLSVAGSAIAADGKILPGLWQFSSQGSMRGMMEAQMKELEAQLAKMPPAQQAQMRAMMQAQMADVTRAQDECITVEQASKGLKHVVEEMKDDEQCQQAVKWYGATKAEVRMSCPDGDVSDYTIEIKSPKRIESTMTITPPANSGGSPSTMNWVGSWKQAKCG